MAISLKKNPKSEDPAPASAPAPSAPAASAVAPAVASAPVAAPAPAEDAEEHAETGGEEQEKSKLSANLDKVAGPLGKAFRPVAKFYASSPKRFFAAVGCLTAVLAVTIGVLLFWEKYQYSRMMSFYVSGNFAKAADGFSNYLQVNPNDTHVMRMLAVTHFNAGNHDLSARTLNRLQTNFTEFENHPEIWYRKALLELSRPGFGDASTNLDHALEADGNHVPSLYMRAALVAGEGGHEEAKLAFERIVGLMKKESHAGLEALILAREVDFINNLTFDRPAMALSSTPPLRSLKLTAPVPLAARTGLQVDAAGFDNRYYVPLPLPPASSSGALPLAGMEQLIAVNLSRQALQGEGSLPAARAYVNELAKTPENKRFGGYLSAYLAALTEEYKLAAAIYQEYDDQELHPLIMRANALWAESGGAPPGEDLMALYEKALDLDATSALALNNLGFFHLYLGNEEKALDLLTRAFDSYPGEKTGLNLALIEIERGNAQEARNKLYSLLENVGEDNLVLTRALVIAELAMGLDQSAKEGLARWKKLESDSPAPYLIASEVHRRTGQQLLRLHELEEGIKLFPENHEFAANLVLTHLSLNDVKAARAALSKAPDAARDNFLVLAARALLTGQDNPEEAGKLFARAQAEAPLSDVFQVAEMRARFLIESGLPEEAQRGITSAVEKLGASTPPSLRALELRILAATRAGSAGAVAAEGEGIIARTDPQLNSDRIVDVARALMALGKYQDAADSLDALLEKVPSVRGQQAAYDAYVKLGRDEDAAAVKRRLDHLAGGSVQQERQDLDRNASVFIIGSPSDFSRQINLALAENDLEKAVALYTQVIETGKPRLKSEAKTYLNRGLRYWDLKKYAEAAEDFAKAEQLEGLAPKETALRGYQHALALQRMGRHADAIEELVKALEFDAKNLQYRLLHGHLLRRADRLDEAEEVLDGLLRESPLQESAYFELAELKRRDRKDNDGAIRVLQSLLEVAPRNVRAHRKLADVYASNGQPEKAKQHHEILKTL